MQESLRTQRLAASMEISLSQNLGFLRAIVLNALRHQWKFHLREREKEGWARVVLNALRHQWKFHEVEDEAAEKAPDVLNALRHQWKFHLATAIFASSIHRCSTPCGINGNFTVMPGASAMAMSCAQRLAASMEISHQ